jgi:hypothetical protein
MAATILPFDKSDHTRNTCRQRRRVCNTLVKGGFEKMEGCLKGGFEAMEKCRGTN